MNHNIPTSLSVQSTPATGPEVRIRVNAINPGLVITEGVTTAGFEQSAFRKTLESQTPLGRKISRRRRSSSLHSIRNGSPAKHYSSREVFVRHLQKMTSTTRKEN
jgi:NAD(P)-dependent dehydrogenase (short-subunit alcohol dehydrogenase family)